MIRPFTLITMMLAAGSGAYLFAVKHRAQTLDDQLAAIDKNAQQDVQRITVLQAQWALEIDPTRMDTLAKQFLTLQPMKPAQLVTLESLRTALPPPDAAPVDAPAAAPELPAIAASTGPPAVAPPATSLPLPPPEAPGLAKVASVAARAPHLGARPVNHSALHLAETRLAEDLSPPRSPGTPVRPGLPLGAPDPAPLTASVTPVSAASGSMLGMAADLAPPQPLPQSLGN